MDNYKELATVFSQPFLGDAFMMLFWHAGLKMIVNVTQLTILGM